MFTFQKGIPLIRTTVENYIPSIAQPVTLKTVRAMGQESKDNASKGPAAFPNNMGEAYIYWRIMEGVPDSMMYAFQGTLTDNDAWDITLNLIDKLGGGK